MLKAVLKKGAIVPIEPVPSDWEEGARLEIAKLEQAPLDVDTWASMMKQLCADSLPEDEAIMRRAIDEHRREAKAQVRRDMGLPE